MENTLTTHSAIGPAWPPEYDEVNHRVKGLCPQVINSWTQLNPRLEELRVLRQATSATRTTARFIIADGSEIDGGIEARVRLTGRWKGHSLCYFGWNEANRSAETESDDALAEERRFASYLMAKDSRVPIRITNAVLADQRIEYAVIRNPSNTDIEQITRLYGMTYSAYPSRLDADSVRGWCEEPNTIVGVLRGRNGIISIGIIESRIISTIGGPGELRISEISAVATNPLHEGKGLYTALGKRLLHDLMPSKPDLVYGEARACVRGVNVACRKMGREYGGTLPKHCIMDGRREIEEEGIFENLNVWAITSDALQELHWGEHYE